MKARDVNVDQWLAAHQPEVIKDLQTLLRYRTVEDETAVSEPGKPFGAITYDCLQEALGIAKRLGFEGESVDGYCGSIVAAAEDCENEKPETFGILAHLDVVPESTGWDYPPYGAEIADGKLYGRGAIDDKGPAVASLWALKAVKECGYKLKKNVNIILGCNEETGMRCLEYFKEHRPVPDFSISPDGEFPLTNSEKSRAEASFERHYASKICLHSGTVVNAVPGEAEGFVPLPLDAVKAAAEKYAEDSPFAVVATAEEGGTKIKVIGRTAHASMPADGENAMLGMLQLLAQLPLEGEDKDAACSLAGKLGMAIYGEPFDLDKEDMSGRLTFNAGLLDWNEEGYTITFDLRIPISMTEEEVKEKLEKGMAEAGASLKNYEFGQGYCIPDDTPFVQKLMKVFNDRTGENMSPKHIGGGTYARHLPNAVSFGPEGYLCEAHAHVANEFIDLEQLYFNCCVLADAIIALCCE
ncbi:MAG: Sapep family Mn(2+)-dependent dipeptidase [Firmicutes bacterium]|nr:Sapep family Mn(2+)-dependent dipeptidase [Bacillota bacterium]